MTRMFCYSAVMTLLYSAVASAQVTFEHKFPEETKSVEQRESKSTQTLTLAGMDLDTMSSTFIVATTKIGKRAVDGTLKIEEKSDSIQTEISTMDPKNWTRK